MKFTIEWLKAAFIRAIRTGAQVALGLFTVGMAVHEVDWRHVLSVTIVAMVYSLITSVATKLPELEKEELSPDGSLVIDESNPDMQGLFLNFGVGKTVDDIADKDHVVLEVKKEALEPAVPDTIKEAEYEARH